MKYFQQALKELTPAIQTFSKKSKEALNQIQEKLTEQIAQITE